jgi:hypothetical protein
MEIIVTCGGAEETPAEETSAEETSEIPKKPGTGSGGG